MPLLQSEKEEFFSQPHIAIISISQGAKNPPLSVPIWYFYNPHNQELWISTNPKSAKAKILNEVGTLSLAVQSTHPVMKYVTVEAQVSGSEKTTPEQAYAISRRYMPDIKAADDFAENFILAHEDVTYHLTPIRWIGSLIG